MSKCFDFPNNLDKRNDGFPKDPFKKSGFFNLPKVKFCRDPGHNPPSHIHIPQGQGYKHICPKCGQETILIPPQHLL